MSNDLVTPADLAGLPGAPFTDAEVDAAVAAVRGVAGWHIAPVRAETVSVDVNLHERFLPLPTGRLVSVTEIRDVISGSVVPADHYWVSSRMGSVRRASCWPRRYEAVEVTMTHGYEECPPDLLAVIGEAVQARRGGTGGVIKARAAVEYREEYDTSGVRTDVSLGTSGTLARYSLPDWWSWA